MTSKNITSRLFWFLPVLIIILLLSSSFLMWKDAQDISYNLLKSESNNDAGQIKTRLEIFLFERGKDLSHLASLRKNNSPSTFLERFQIDASGIISRERSFYAISFVEPSGKILIRTGLDTTADTSAPIYKLDLIDYLKKLATDTAMIVVSFPISTSRGEKLLAIFKPVFNDNKEFAGALVASLRQKYLIHNVITTPIQRSNFITIYLGDTLLYENLPELKKQNRKFSSKTKSTVIVNSMQKLWKISVYLPHTGLLNELTRQNNITFAINALASVIASWLLALALFISHRLRLTTADLAKSEERYRHLAENASDMIFQQSIPQGVYDYVSPAAERITGYKSVEFYKTPFLFEKILVKEDQDRFRNQWLETMKGKTPSISEFRIIHKSGQTRWLNQNSSLIYDKNGLLVAIEGILTDITDQKNAVFEREKLIKELESKNRDLEHFTYIISHELKTPLITIKGFLGYLEDEATKGDFSGFHQDVTRIITAAETMGHLLNDLVSLNRIGHTKSEMRIVDLNKLVNRCVDFFSEQISSRSIRIIIDQNLPAVNGYYDELLELYENLIDNAIKFTVNQPFPVIEIGKDERDEGVILFVKDNGSGFESKYSERIFGLFDKLDSATRGTGAGLAMVKRIVEHHGGWIKAESAGLGKGTKVYFMLSENLTKE